MHIHPIYIKATNGKVGLVGRRDSFLRFADSLRKNATLRSVLHTETPACVDRLSIMSKQYVTMESMYV